MAHLQEASERDGRVIPIRSLRELLAKLRALLLCEHTPVLQHRHLPILIFVALFQLRWLSLVYNKATASNSTLGLSGRIDLGGHSCICQVCSDVPHLGAREVRRLDLAECLFYTARQLHLMRESLASASTRRILSVKKAIISRDEPALAVEELEHSKMSSSALASARHVGGY